MITELHIENLGVIQHASLQLGRGLTALTGETGAGKTMLVEAIELLVGGRADSAVVRHGASEARVDGRLLIDGDDGPREVILSRVVPADGRSRAYVDGRPATVARLAEIGAGQIDLHGQHAHQSLLTTATQRSALDEFGQVDLGPLREARARLTEIEAELAALGGDERTRAREIDLLRYQVTELEQAEFDDPTEEVALAREEATLGNAVAHREAGAAALDILGADDGVVDRLGEIERLLTDRAPFGDLTQRLHGVVADISDLVAELRDRAESIDEDPERLDAVRERRQLIVDLKRKYGDELSDVIEFLSEARARLDELETYDARAARLDAERLEARSDVDKRATEVAAQRRAAAPLLAAAVEQQLKQLALPNASLSIVVNDGPADLAGDRVEFLLAANPGMPAHPLTKVASGGELARTMLALRLVLSGVSERSSTTKTPLTMVFDEVDAGIGGEAANAVADALATLGAAGQVLVVTHLPQVAAAATVQQVVHKSTDAESTTATVAPVSDDDRITEIARMLSGDAGDAARHHAATMLGEVRSSS